MRIVLRLCGVLAVAAAGTAYSQEPSPAATPAMLDSATQNVVTTFSVKSGKIALSSVANPGPAYLPDGTYTNESSTIIVVLDGKIARLQTRTGEIKEISSVRMNRQNMIMLTPSTNALMQVSDITLPWGTFKSEDGASSFKVMAGRPTTFTLPAR